MPRLALGLLAAALLAACATRSSQGGDGSIRLVIDPAVRHQTIACFGASGAWSFDPVGSQWSEEGKRRLAELLFSTERGIGLSAIKLSIGAGSAATDRERIPPPNEWRRAETVRPTPVGPYDWSRQAGSQWFMRAAREMGVSIQAIVYSPPTWMTTNGHAQPDRASGTTNLREDSFEAFASYIADILERIRDTEGVELESVSPLNEPNWSWDLATQEGNRYSNDEIARIVRLLGSELRRRGLDTRIVVPEAGELLALLDDAAFREYWRGFKSRYEGGGNERSYGGKYREYIRDLLGDPELRELIDSTVSAHSYWSDYDDGSGDDRLVRLRQLVRRNLDQVAPGSAYRQTEYCILGDKGPGRDLHMETALAVATVIHHDLTLLDAEEWSWWLALSPYDYKDGLIYTNYRAPGDPESIILSKLFWAFGNYSRYVRPGFVRVDVTAKGAPAELLASSYQDPADGRLVVVAVNGSTKEILATPEIAGGGEVRGFRAYVTSERDDLAPREPVPGGSAVRIPPRSVITLVSY